MLNECVGAQQGICDVTQPNQTMDSFQEYCFERNMKQVLQESKIAFADKEDEAAFVRRAAEKAGRGEPVHIPLDFAVGKVPNHTLTRRPVNKT